ncbi:LysR family transcriptional regulator [Entomomonas asaccharolytica]|uniref:LysR family transcriptional regulator n=1 Tax=Entomomonas asaccharolytica TaxID=2785331 RepID=A0A974NGF9_9GAMM|nr:LysR family transcriptional regulator [Entomomonas asaccharolytica]QQP86052.1 LysR family transcriptional regulator [Entomomonas asaccharolytica]
MDDSKQFNDLYAYVQVATFGSFTQAATILGVQPSALSHRIKDLEKRLKIKLLNRTTRSVSTTEAGQQLLERTAPMFATIQQELSALSDYTNKMSGKIRINSPERPAFELIYPKINGFLAENPDVELEIFINNRYCDIVAERFDFGVRSGQDVAQDMIAVRISDENTMTMVASPSYIDQFGKPKSLKELIHHRCIVLSFNPEYRLSEWEFIENNQLIKIRVPEKLIFSSISLVKQAAIDGLGVTWIPSTTVQADVEAGQLVELFAKSNITYPPTYIYYPKNKHKTNAMAALIDLLRQENHKSND